MSGDEGPRPKGSSLADLPQALAGTVTAELRDGESLVWLGQPKPELLAKAVSWPGQLGWMVATLAVVWLFFSVGNASPLTEKKDEPNIAGFPLNAGALLGLAFFVLGACLMTVSAWNRKCAKKTCYALTNQRAITWQPTFFGKPLAKSFDRDQLGTTRLLENADGFSSLVFRESMTGTKNMHVKFLHGFLCIDEPRKVEELLRRTLLE